MKKTNIVVLALLIFMTQVPVLIYNYYFMYDDNKPIECKYVLVSVGWMIVVLYIIHFVWIILKIIVMNNVEEPLGVLLLCLIRIVEYIEKTVNYA